MREFYHIWILSGSIEIEKLQITAVDITSSIHPLLFRFKRSELNVWKRRSDCAKRWKDINNIFNTSLARLARSNVEEC